MFLTLCDPVDCSLPDSSVHGILQAGEFQGLLSFLLSPGYLPDPGIEPGFPAFQEVSLPLRHLGSIIIGMVSSNDFLIKFSVFRYGINVLLGLTS